MKRLSTLAAVLTGLSGAAAAADATAPPAGATRLLELVGDGVQVYYCDASGGSYAWVFRLPEAALFDSTGRQVGSHGAGPRWTLVDGSSVLGEKVEEAPVPDPHAIPWLLLRVNRMTAPDNWPMRSGCVARAQPAVWPRRAAATPLMWERRRACATRRFMSSGADLVRLERIPVDWNRHSFSISSFPRKRASRATGTSPALDPRFAGTPRRKWFDLRGPRSSAAVESLPAVTLS